MKFFIGSAFPDFRLPLSWQCRKTVSVQLSSAQLADADTGADGAAAAAAAGGGAATFGIGTLYKNCARRR